jgi:GNAT superfamily N-acetyltransferase
MAPSEPIIGGLLSAAEFPDAETLVREAGWNQVTADWEIFRALGTVYAARADGRVVATAATLPYGEFAWISMVLVLPAYRRHGLGTRLLKHCVTMLTEQHLVPVLDATPAGRPIYEAIGFQETWSYQRLARSGRPAGSNGASVPDGVIIRPIVDADWDALVAYDAGAFGADRSALLKRLRGRLPPAELVAERRGRVAGFMLGRDGRSAVQIGPVVAEDDAVAQALLARSLGSIADPIYIDLADAKTRIGAWLSQSGFSAQRPLTRMLLGRNRGFDDPARTFAVIGPEFG